MALGLTKQKHLRKCEKAQPSEDAKDGQKFIRKEK
jgi:hypothetical protein